MQTNGKYFELYDGILKPGIIAQLDELNKTCRLPESPYNIRSVLKVNWERIIIEPNKFEGIHNAFIKALEELAMKIRHRYNPLIETGNYYIPVHVPTYTIIYDNHTEHIEIYGEDVEDAEGRFNPVIEWVKTIKII